jgi:hypothetical protein
MTTHAVSRHRSAARFNADFDLSTFARHSIDGKSF